MSLLIALYLGITGYYTETSKLRGFSSDLFNVNSPSQKINASDIERVKVFVNQNKVYLDPDLTLAQISKGLKMSPTQVSEIINSGMGKNFNDYINGLRVEAVKVCLHSDEYNHFSLLAIAMECGFNSKATFNRVIKKMTSKSPSDFKKDR